jgi:hypothetical protein
MYNVPMSTFSLLKSAVVAIGLLDPTALGAATCQTVYRAWFENGRPQLSELDAYEPAPVEKVRLEKMADEHSSRMSARQKSAVEYYANLDGYKEINSLVRRLAPKRSPLPAPKDSSPYNENMVTAVEALDDLTLTRRVPGNWILFRGLSLVQHKIPKIGDEVLDHGWDSMTIRPSIAVWFADKNARGRKRVILMLKTPREGYPGFVPKKRKHASELEIILPRATRYKVGDVYESEGAFIVKGTLLPLFESDSYRNSY